MNKLTRLERAEMIAAAQKCAAQALDTLVDVMMNGSSDAARVSASTAILDRAYGKTESAVLRFEAERQKALSYELEPKTDEEMRAAIAELRRKCDHAEMVMNAV